MFHLQVWQKLEYFFGLLHGDWFSHIDGEWLKTFFEEIDYFEWFDWYNGKTKSPVKERKAKSPPKKSPDQVSQVKVVPGFSYGELERIAPASEETRAEWRAAASSGSPTSASPPVEVSPVVVTPERQQMLQPLSETPPKLPRPLAKVTLTANKRLQQKLAKAKAGKLPSSKNGPLKKDKKPPVSTKNKSESKQSKRTNSNGPMQQAMADFLPSTVVLAS